MIESDGTREVVALEGGRWEGWRQDGNEVGKEVRERERETRERESVCVLGINIAKCMTLL